MSAKVLILHAPGTNRDGDLAHAISTAGGFPHVMPLSDLRRSGLRWLDYAMLALPGGFSFGDALGAGRLWALDLQTWFQDSMLEFIERGRAVIGICNGFQALVKCDILPGDGHRATLTSNSSGHFECRWVHLAPNQSNPSPWLADLPAITCPVAHGEGRYLYSPANPTPSTQVAFSYALDDGSSAEGRYPANPNGSAMDIAGITNALGNVLGLMPHPEDHIHPYQHPAWTRAPAGGMGTRLFENGLSIG